jgi:hypothetical protein
MARDVLELVEPYLSPDPARWSRLASDIQWRRTQLLLLREILVEVRKLNRSDADRQKDEQPGRPST